MEKTHWRTAFKSDYLSSADVDRQDLTLTIEKVRLQECVSQSGKKLCNVAHFVGAEYDRRGNLTKGTKPMILNVTNSKVVKKFANNTTHLEEWQDIPVTIYVDRNVRFGSETTEGLE